MNTLENLVLYAENEFLKEFYIIFRRDGPNEHPQSMFGAKKKKKKKKKKKVKYSKIPILRPPLGLSKSVLKTTFGQSQRWSLSRCTLGVENEGEIHLNFQNRIFNR